MKSKKENINTVLPNGIYFRQPSNTAHKDRTTYSRKQKYKEKIF